MIGFDVDGSKVQELAHGRSYIAHIHPTRIERLASAWQLRVISAPVLISTSWLNAMRR